MKLGYIDYRQQTAQFGMCSAFTPATMTCRWESSWISSSSCHQSAAQFRRASCSLSRLQMAAVEQFPVLYFYCLFPLNIKGNCVRNFNKQHWTRNNKPESFYITVRLFKTTNLSLKYYITLMHLYLLYTSKLFKSFKLNS